MNWAEAFAIVGSMWAVAITLVTYWTIRKILP